MESFLKETLKQKESLSGVIGRQKKNHDQGNNDHYIINITIHDSDNGKNLYHKDLCHDDADDE